MYDIISKYSDTYPTERKMYCCSPNKCTIVLLKMYAMHLHARNMQTSLPFGGIRGFPLAAHQPTGCTSCVQRFTQKSAEGFVIPYPSNRS